MHLRADDSAPREPTPAGDGYSVGMKAVQVALRVVAISVTLGSIVFMFLPQSFRGPMLGLGLGGQFLLGTVVVLALAFEVFHLASGHRR